MTAADILEEFVRVSPDFRDYWAGTNYHVGDDGSYAPSGVFSQFTDYFRERHLMMTTGQLEALAALIARCEREEFLAEAAYTCFLENIAGDPPGATLAPYLSAAAVEFMSHWKPHE